MDSFLVDIGRYVAIFFNFHFAAQEMHAVLVFSFLQQMASCRNKTETNHTLYNYRICYFTNRTMLKVFSW